MGRERAAADAYPVPGDAAYRDPSRPVEERVADLLARMTMEEKAGQLFHTMIAVGQDGALAAEQDPVFGIPPTPELVHSRHLTHFNVLASPPTAAALAAWHNRLQALAEETRLGIPVTLSSDPRHAFTDNPGTALLAGPFSQWPETLGLAAVGDDALVERFADTVRREYLAVGIRTALHPQVDLATEPRWARANGTFGEDVDLTTRMGVAYVRGLQGTDFGASSVSAMVKHFPGGGPQQDGEDPHFPYGREQVYPGGQFELHLRPFPALIAAGIRQLMPYYGMPIGLVLDGEEIEPVGFGFNRQILTGLLRDELGFDGIVCTDWGLVSDSEILGQPFPARAWGVEHLDRAARIAKILDAGADQLGGEACPEIVVDLVRSGRIEEARIDESVRRLVREKFLLGLFDERRYVDVDAAEATVGRADFRAEGRRAQSQAVTVLRNADDGPARLPLDRGVTLYVEGVPEDEAAAVWDVVTPRLEEAEVALIRLKAPYEERGPGFASFFHAGSLDFPAEVIERVRRVASQVPTIVEVYLDRPAVLTPLADVAATLVVEFGAGTAPLLDALSGVVPPCGRLPFDLPRSMVAVEGSREDMPFDTEDPLFRCGDGLEI